MTIEQKQALDQKTAAEHGSCPACRESRYHTEEEWKNHPLRGHGFVDNQGWTHPILRGA